MPVLLYRTDGTVYAPASTCTHMGGPLQEDAISDGCLTCQWPGSTFRFADGSIMRSPASTPELSYQTRIQTGVSRSAPSHRRCGPRPSARVVTEDTVLGGFADVVGGCVCDADGDVLCGAALIIDQSQGSLALLGTRV